MRKFQNGIIVNKGATENSSVERDNVAGTEAGSTPKTAETTTVTAKAGAASVTTTTTPTETNPEEKKTDAVVVSKDGNVTVKGGDAHGGDVVVTVNFGTVNTSV